MKNLILLLLFTFLSITINAQISEVKTDGSSVKLYNDKGQYSNSIYLGENTLLGYTTEYVLIQDASYLKIYNHKGQYTGNSIYISDLRKFKSVNESRILLKEGSYVKYYNFEGRCVNQTYDDSGN